MRTGLICLATLLAAGPALAQEAPAGEAAAGEVQFNRQCVSCHVVQNDAGEVLAGRNAKVGPNLYRVIGRVAGSYPEFNYSELMETYGATGAVWAEENFVAYVQDPTDYLREATGQSSGRSKMAYQVRDAQDAQDLYAYLATFSAEAMTAQDSAEAAME
jgi:cytochrome c